MPAQDRTPSPEIEIGDIMSGPIDLNTKVRYHGSMSERRTFPSSSPWNLIRFADIEFVVKHYKPSSGALSSDGFRYTIVPTDPAIVVGESKMSNYLTNVRRQSITPVEAPVESNA
jgi:hypothetical protein